MSVVSHGLFSVLLYRPFPVCSKLHGSIAPVHNLQAIRYFFDSRNPIDRGLGQLLQVIAADPTVKHQHPLVKAANQTVQRRVRAGTQPPPGLEQAWRLFGCPT
jgi:hypothetical protein